MPDDSLEAHDRLFLDKLRLAATVILELSEDSEINDVLATELHLLLNRIDRCLLLPGAGRAP